MRIAVLALPLAGLLPATLPAQGLPTLDMRLMDTALPRPQGRVSGAVSHAWFWAGISPSRAAASPSRWSTAIATVNAARARGVPVHGGRERLSSILAANRAALDAAAARHKLSLPLLLAVISVESGGSARAVSPKGAQGLMQLMPATAARFGVSDAFQPGQNIAGGARYLDWLLRRFGEDAILALAAYNAGEQTIDSHAGVPPWAETRDYVAKVAGAFALARLLCARPPEGPRGACALP